MNIEMSRREVFDAVWKSSPYGFVAVFSAAAYTVGLVIANGLEPALILIPLVMAVALAAVTYSCWKQGKYSNKKIATYEVLWENIGRITKEREAVVKSAMTEYKKALMRSPFSKPPVLLDSQDIQMAEMTLHGLYGKARIDDMKARYRFLVDDVERLESITEKYIEAQRTLQRTLKEKIFPTIAKHLSIMNPEAARQWEQAIMFIRIGRQKNLSPQLLGQNPQVQGKVEKKVEDLLDMEPKDQIVRALLDDKDINRDIDACLAIYAEGINALNGVVPVMEYHFPVEYNRQQW